MTNKQHDETYRRIEKHGTDLINVFHLPPDTDPVKLCKRIMRVEKDARRLTTNLCNTNNLQGIEPHYAPTGKWVQIESSKEEQETAFEAIRNRVYIILGKDVPFFINYDPRGCALKIKDDYMRKNAIQLTRDWGGYGILAPDFTPQTA